MDEQTLTDQWDQHSKDPFPIYTVIDKQSKGLCWHVSERIKVS